MFERAPAIVLSLLLIMSTTASAQPASPRELQLRALIDSLLPIEAELRAREAARHLDDPIGRIDAEELRSGLDTTRVGPLTIIAFEDDSELLTEWFRTEWTKADPFVQAAAPLLEGTVLTVTHGRRSFALDEYSKKRGHRHLDFYRSWPWQARAQARSTLGSLITFQLPPELWHWRRGETMLRETAAKVYRELALGRGYASRDCFAGDDTACLLALGVRDAGPDYSGWFTPADLRAVVMADRRYPGDTRHKACGRAVRSACIQYARDRDLEPPLRGFARMHFLEHVFARGGPDGLRRLMHTTLPRTHTAADVEARLRLAEPDLESAVRSWRADLFHAHERARRAGIASMFTALVWIALFAIFSSRSSRWRFG